MKFIVSKLGKKAISIICALSIILSVVGVAFGTFASGGSEAAFGVYTVNADTAPAIPMFSLTQVDLAKTVEVKFAGDSAATKGEDITWTLLEGGENILTLDGTVVTAYKSGVYKLKAEAGGKTATLWIVVANQTDSAWNLYSIDFDKIAKENNYAGLTFVRGGNTTVKNASGGNSTYSTGEFKYTDANGTVTVDNANIPENLKFPTGWSAYTWALVNGPLSGDPEIQKIPFVMPYGHTVEGNASDSYVTRRDNVTSGIMPFDNPYKANLLGVGIDANTNIAYSLGLGDSHVRGYFVLNNEITQAFRDYKINANMDVAIASLISSNAVNRVGLFGRLRMNPNTGKPKTDMVYTINATKVPSNNASIAGTAGGNRYIWTAADYTNANWYGTFSEYKVSHVYFDVMLKNQMHPFQAIPGGVAMTGYGVNYSFRGGVSVPGGMDEANGVPYIRWDYLLNKNFNEGNQTNIRTNLQLSLTYEGDTATMSSPLSATSITFDNVYTDKGAVGVCIGSIDEANQYLNVHQFSIELLNDITAENNGTQYPYYTELDLYKVLATNPALPMYSATFVNKGDFAVQGEDSSMYLGSDLTFTFKNLDAEGNELDTPVIGVKDDVAAGRIYAYKKGAYKATVTETATGKKIAEIWVAVKDNKGEDWVLYDIDFDKIAADNEYDKLTFVESGETNTVASARTEEKYKYKTYITGALTYKGEEVTHANIPDALKLPAGWNTVIRGAEYGVITNWNKVPFVMPYSHTAVEGATPSYTRKVSTGLMPFDNPYAANGLGFDMNVPINVNSVLSEGGYTKGYFILNNDITKAFADYKVTADMDMASYNMVHGTFNSGYNMGIVGRLPVDENSIPTDVPFAGYSVTDSYSGSSFSTVSYNNTEKTGYTATTFLVNLRADNTNPCGVLKYD
ncbi:MAG: hypothetical protein IKK13_00955, partial [Clostridia bacterium]|nr:hypothetical protein [Clostridia bacterium]